VAIGDSEAPGTPWARAVRAAHLAQSIALAGEPSPYRPTEALRRTDGSTAIASPAARRPRPLALLALAAALALSGCSSSDDAASDNTSAAAPSVSVVEPADALEAIGVEGTTVIDVRTPAEYADGHLTGARNIDLSADTFTDQVSELDRDAAYVVYCRTGARSAEAAARMADLGFTDVLDAGGLSDLVDAGGNTETT
jgi:phage shock protein E